jgi:hypothetical protein
MDDALYITFFNFKEFVVQDKIKIFKFVLNLIQYFEVHTQKQLIRPCKINN